MALDLGKQVGPLPLGAWVAVVGGGLGLAYYAKQHSGTPTPVTDTSGQAGVGDGSTGGWVPTTPGTSTDITEPAPATNEAWAVKCINWLIAQGYDASVSDSAMRKYIAGNEPAPSAQEYVLQGLALTHFGSPPNPLPPSYNPPPVIPPPTQPPPPPVETPHPVPPPPAPAPPPPPANVRWYTVVKGDNLWNIAKKYYGNGAQYVRIFNANRVGVRRADGSNGMISNPNLIYPGWRLIIP